MPISFRWSARGFALAAGLAALVTSPAFAEQKCTNPNALGVSRVVEIDPTGGPGFGFENYKDYDFLQPREVVLTFDDGPQKFYTDEVLAALEAQCTKAIFFSIGKMALGYPEILRHVADAGMTIGTHTWSHALLRKFKTDAEAIDEIERGMSAVKRALGPGSNVAPFFRYPGFQDTPGTLEYLRKRNIAIWSTDIDSWDFKFRNTEHTIKTVIDKLEKRGKGIILMHDIQPTTAKGVPMLLALLKEHGFKIVQVRAKGTLTTLPEFDKAIEADVKGLAPAGSERPVGMVVRTISGDGGDAKSNLGGEPAATTPAPVGTPVPAHDTTAAAGSAPDAGASAPLDAAGKPQKKWFFEQK